MDNVWDLSLIFYRYSLFLLIPFMLFCNSVLFVDSFSNVQIVS